MKKKIRAAIYIIWALIGITLLVSIGLADTLELSKAIITDMVKIYVILAIPMSVVLYFLSKSIHGEKQKR